MRLADYIVERLHAEGVNHIFTVTGRGSLFLSDAVAKSKMITSISTHHEQAAGFSAVSYAQFNGRLGACFVSTGCASTNVITAVLSAWQDGVPCIFVSGQNTLNQTSRHTGIPLRTFGQQETDIIKLVEPITKFSEMVTRPEDIGYTLDKALHLACSGRKGPVWIDVPLDIQSMSVDPVALRRLTHSEMSKPCLELNVIDLSRLIDAFNIAQRPVLLIGNGVNSADAVCDMENLLSQFPVPVTFSASAVDCYGTENMYSIGSVGMMGCSRAGNFAVQNADLLVVVGCRLNAMTTGVDFDLFAREAKIIVVDIDLIEHSKKSVRIDHIINSDCKIFFNDFISNISKLKPVSEEWINKCVYWKSYFPSIEKDFNRTDKVDLYQLADALSEMMPDNSALVCDSGLVELILPTNMKFGGGKRCIHPVSQGAMGYALPGAIGVHYAGASCVVAVIGDGSIMMNLQELQTIRYNKIPIKLFVINNNAYSIIRKRQEELFRGRTIGTDHSNGVDCPDFEEVASCFGFKYYRINNVNELKNSLSHIFNDNNFLICEIIGFEDQNYIQTSYGKNSQNRIVRRPLEDQAPFLDRNIFQSEMIVKTLE